DVYRHYKGHEYRVFGIATHSESEEQMVVYQALYGDYGLWIRPLRMFCETVDVNGERLPRFALIREEPSLIGLAPGQEAWRHSLDRGVIATIYSGSAQRGPSFIYCQEFSNPWVNRWSSWNHRPRPRPSTSIWAASML